MSVGQKRSRNNYTIDSHFEDLEECSKRKQRRINTPRTDVQNSLVDSSLSQQIILEDALDYNAIVFQPTYDTEINSFAEVERQVNDETTMGTVPNFSYNKNQSSILEDEFKKCQWIDCQRRRELASILNWTEIQIENWFAIRRVEKQCTEQEQYDQLFLRQTEPTINSPLTTLSDKEYTVKKNLFSQSHLVKSKEENEHFQLPYNNTFSELTPEFRLTDDDVKSWADDRLSEQRNQKQRFSSLTTSTELVSFSRSTRLSKLDARRTYFSENQRAKLEKKFEECRYVSYDEANRLALDVNLTIRQIRRWFINQRSKQKITNNLQLLQSPNKMYQNLSPSVNTSEKKRRFHFNESQLTILEHEFEKCQYPQKDSIFQLASAINITADRVRAWFGARRYREKNSKKLCQAVQSQTEIPDSTTPSALGLAKYEICQSPDSCSSPTCFSPNGWIEQQCDVENSWSKCDKQSIAFPRDWQCKLYDEKMENSVTLIQNKICQSPFFHCTFDNYSPTWNDERCGDEGIMKSAHQTDISSQDCQYTVVPPSPIEQFLDMLSLVEKGDEHCANHKPPTA